LDSFRRRDGVQKVGQIASQSVQSEPDSIGSEAHVAKSCPFQRVLAFLDMLLRRSLIIVKGQDPLVRQASAGDDKSDLWE
jgi:hypothetical protein